MARARTMTLVIDTSARRVLFAEAGMAVIDGLFSLLEGSPDAPVVYENETDRRRGIDNFCDSFDELEDAIHGGPPPPPEERFFVCSYRLGGAGCDAYLTAERGARCPSCGWEMATEVRRSPGAGTSAQGAAAMCVVMDDLTVTPMAASGVAVGALRAAAGSAVQEETVRIGYKEGLAILNAAMQSTTVLTDVFLGNEAPADS
ncbi:hypothetical protein ACP70R_030497 [Stipagrostis hirtigluma subsp. patula]